MVAGDKFYIYGGGKWREIDISDGRVEGWGRARFVFPKRGKVRVAKTPAVLTALRNLTAGQTSAVKDGARLPYKMSKMFKRKEKVNHGNASNHQFCCQQSNNDGCITHNIIDPKASRASIGIQCISKTDACIQTSIPSQTIIFSDSLNRKNIQQKRPRTSTTSEEVEPTKITTTATVHPSSSKKKHQKDRRSRNIRSEEEIEGTMKKRVPSLKLEKADSSNYNLYKRRRSKSSDSVVWVVLPKNTQNGDHKSPKRKITEYLKAQSRNVVATKLFENSSSNKTTKLPSKNHTMRSRSYHDKPNLPLSNTEIPTFSSNENTNQEREIIIDEGDVDILRSYLLKHVPDFDLLQFDQDDEYKRCFFYKINPLVYIKRCPQIDRMLHDNIQENLSLKDFASQLGLRSVKEKSSQTKRYKMRKLDKKRTYLNGVTSDSDTDKENSEWYKGKRYTSKKDLDRLNKPSIISSQGKKNISKLKIVSEDSNTETSEEGSEKPPTRSDRLLRESNRTQYNHENREILSKSKMYKTRSSVDNKKRYVESTESSTDDSESVFMIKNVTDKIPKEGQKRINNNVFSPKHRTRKLGDKRNVRKPSESDNENSGAVNSYSSDDTNTDDESSDTTELKSSKNNIKRKTKHTENIKTSKLHLTVDDSDDEKLKELKSPREMNSRSQKKTIEKEKFNNDTTSRGKNATTKISKELSKKDLNKGNDNTSKSKINDSIIEDSQIPKDRKIYNKHNSRMNKELKELLKSSSNIVIEDSQKPVDKKNYTKHKSSMKKELKELLKPPYLVYQNSSRQLKRKIQEENNDKVIPEVFKETGKSDVQNKKTNNDKEIVQPSKSTKDIVKNNNSMNESLNSSNEGNNVPKNNSNKDLVIKEIKQLAVIPKRTISKRPLSSANREYSSLEDHAIVSWLSLGGRAQCVNGNRIWRDLESDFVRIAGQKRSFHSLRNRYLRYILPSLGSLALPQAQVTRLRAAAATGELKSRKLAPRRNSIFGVPTRGALSRRPAASRSSSQEPPPKRHKHDNKMKVKSPSPKRVLRSSLASPGPRHSPRYSDIVRNFADTRHNGKSTPASSPSTKQSLDSKEGDKSTTTNLNGKLESKNRLASQDSSATKSTTLRLSLRRSFRNKDSPVLPVVEKSQEIEKTTRTRKLYNPGSVM